MSDVAFYILNGLLILGLVLNYITHRKIKRAERDLADARRQLLEHR